MCFDAVCEEGVGGEEAWVWGEGGRETKRFKHVESVGETKRWRGGGVERREGEEQTENEKGVEGRREGVGVGSDEGKKKKEPNGE